MNEGNSLRVVLARVGLPRTTFGAIDVKTEAVHVLQPTGNTRLAPISQGRVRAFGCLGNDRTDTVSVQLLREVDARILAHDGGVLGGQPLHGLLARGALGRPLSAVRFAVEVPIPVQGREVEGSHRAEAAPAIADARRVGVRVPGDSQVGVPRDKA